MTTEPTNRDHFSDWRPAAGTRQYCGELELTIPIDRDNYFTITADPDTVAMVPVVLRQLLAQPKPEGDGLFHWRNLGDGKPVQVRECPICGIAPANVDDCGRFGDPACPYFGVGEPEPEGVGEVKELVDWLNASAREWVDLREYDEGSKCRRAADILTRFARPTIQPVPVSERPWEREGWCDEYGMCWRFDPCDRGWWSYGPILPSDGDPAPFTHLLPHHALPVPGAEEQP